MARRSFVVVLGGAVLVAPALGLSVVGRKPGGDRHLQRDMSDKEIDNAPHVGIDGKCPHMPKSSKEWEDSFLWGVFIDGKDVESGPHVYDWDHEFFYKVSGSLTKVYKMEKTDEGKADLSVELIEELRKGAWDGSAKYDPPQYKGGGGIMPHCTDRMKCEDRLNILQHIPEYLYTFKNGTEDCPKGLRPHVHGEKSGLLEKIVASYNEALEAVRAKGNRRSQLLNAVVGFVRSFAFLHPFQNGNGRLRNILLQREIRRLGIGCATMMYNNNKDAFVDGWSRYRAKVLEGIEAFEASLETKANPWSDPQRAELHHLRFKTMHGLKECAEKNMGSGGSIQ